MERTTSSIIRVWLQWKLLTDGLLVLLKPVLVREADHVGPGFFSSKAARVPSAVSIRFFRAAFAKKTREELDLEKLRGKFTGVTGAGRQGSATTNAVDGADGERSSRIDCSTSRSS